MPLPDRPDLDQLRRQARELLRAAQRGDANAVLRLRAVTADRATLGAAQLALARELGFPSWAALKAEVEIPAGDGPLVVRPVASAGELALAFDVAGAQFTRPITSADRRFADVERRLGEDRPMMVVAEGRAGMVGSALGFRSNHGAGVLRIVGVVPEARGVGVGRRLVEEVVVQATALCCPSLAVGGVTPATKGFYERLGFHGRRSTLRRDLLPARRVPPWAGCSSPR